MLTDAAKNEALDALTLGFVTAHDGFPGTAGNNEITAITRVAIAWNSASAGNLDSNGTPALTIPAGETVRWLGLWTLASGGVFKGYSPNGAAGKRYTADSTGNTITSPAHGYSNADKVVFYGGNVPGGLTEGTIYFVVGATTDTFQVEATVSGGAISLTDENNDGLVSAITEETYGAEGTFNVNDFDIALSNN